MDLMTGKVSVLFHPFNNPEIAHSPITKCLQRSRVCRTVIRGSCFLQALIFNNHGALFQPMFTGSAQGNEPQKV